MIISFLDIRAFWLQAFLVAKEGGELIVWFFLALVDTRRSLGRDGPAVVVANATVAWCVFRGRTVALRRRNDVQSFWSGHFGLIRLDNFASYPLLSLYILYFLYWWPVFLFLLLAIIIVVWSSLSSSSEDRSDFFQWDILMAASLRIFFFNFFIFRHEQWKNLGYQGYIGDDTTQFCGDNNKPI